jgi:hypothetical protein
MFIRISASYNNNIFLSQKESYELLFYFNTYSVITIGKCYGDTKIDTLIDIILVLMLNELVLKLIVSNRE